MKNSATPANALQEVMLGKNESNNNPLTRKRKNKKIIYAFSFLLLFVFGIEKTFAQLKPYVYYTFDNATPQASDGSLSNCTTLCDLTGPFNGTTNVTVNTNSFATVNTNHITVDETSVNTSLYMNGTGGFDISTNNSYTVEFLFRVDPATAANTGLQRSLTFFHLNNGASIARINIGYPNIAFETDFLGYHAIPLDGIGRKSWTYLTDGNWHHIAFVAVGNTGGGTPVSKVEVWIDGELIPECIFTGATTSFSSAVTRINLSDDNNFDKMVGDLDEVAVFTDALTPDQIYSHYQDAKVSHIRYRQNTFTTYPGPSSTIGTYDANEFPVGYSPCTSFPCTPSYASVLAPSIQLKSFPLARYKPVQMLHKNINWMNTCHLANYFGGSIGAGDPKITESVNIQDELANNWNFYYNVSENTGTTNLLTDFGLFQAAWITEANTHTNPNIEYSVLTFRDQIHPVEADPTWLNGEYLKEQSLQTWTWPPPVPPSTTLQDFYLTDGTGNFIDPIAHTILSTNFHYWSPSQDVATYDYDGKTQRYYIEQIYNVANTIHLNNSKIIKYISEDSETPPHIETYDNSAGYLTTNDTYLNSKFLLSSFYPNWKNFIGDKKYNLDIRYRDEFLNNIPQLSGSWFTNYGIDGRSSGVYDYTTNSFKSQSQINGQYYPTPWMYPQLPVQWLYDNGYYHCWDYLMKERVTEINVPYNQNFLAPFVSPGYGYYQEEIMRPAQYLGLLKCMAMTGVDFFHSFNLDNPYDNTGEGAIWELTSPSYAQAISGRYYDYLVNGTLMTGDRPDQTQPGSGINYFAFNTGNASDLVVARKDNALSKYAITGAIMKLENYSGTTVNAKNVTINLDGNSVSFEIRRQGSTYIFDNSGVAPVFYQLDKWHENTHPQHWTSDFDLEAEVLDNGSNLPDIKTEGPNVATYDFTNYTSYVSFSSTSQITEYNFQPRADGVNNDYDLWIKARCSQSNNTTGATITLTDNVGNIIATNSISCIDASGWAWYRVDACTANNISYAGLTNDMNYKISFSPENTFLEIDRVYLDAPDGVNQTFTPVGVSCTPDVTFNNGDDLNSQPVPNGSKVLINGVVVVTSPLTFTNCRFAMAGYSQINVTGGAVDFINCQFQSECGTMWNGIENITLGSGGIVNADNCIIRDAVLFAKTSNGNKLNITNNTFDYNYSCLWFENGNYPSSIIFGNTFACTGGVITKVPHANQQPQEIIHLENNVTGLTIGDAVAQNKFSDAVYGVSADRSSFELKNNSFTMPTLQGNAYGVKATDLGLSGNYFAHFNPNGTLAEQNTFTNLGHGVLTAGIGEVIGDNNVFNNCSNSYIIGKAAHTLIQNNILNNYGIGIGVYDGYSMTGGRATRFGIRNDILNNHLNQGSSFPLQVYGRTAIDVQNSVPSEDLVTVSGNDILNSATGIHARNAYHIKIGLSSSDYNTYEDQMPDGHLFSYYLHFGIWVENSFGAQVLNNNVRWTGGTIDPSSAYLIKYIKGIAIARTNKCIVKENVINNMAAGVNVFDDCSGSSLLCNDMQVCFNGVYLDPSSPTSLLGTQGGYTGTQTTSISWDNKWTNNAGPMKVDGNTWGGQSIIWVYDPSATADYDPQPSAFFVTRQPGNLHNGCNIPLLLDAQERSRLFGDAVWDSTATDGDTLEFIITDKEAFYKQAKKDTTILTKGVSSDVAFHSEFNDLKQGNIGKYEEVKDSLAAGNNTAALQKLFLIVDQNIIEQNKKYVSSLIAVDYDPSLDADSDTVAVLTNIAMMHPFYGGEAVYWARAILRLDINDELPALRKSHANQQTSAPNEIVQTEKLVPNPATDVVTLNSNEPFGDNELITVFNFLQQKIIEYKLPDKQKQFVFDTTNLLQGIYFIKHTNGGKIISEDKLVIIK